MNEFQFDRKSANVWMEQVIGRLRQYVYGIKPDRMLSVDEFAERVTLVFLRELRDVAWLTENDAQLVIQAAMGMHHGCLQMLATAADLPRPMTELTKEMVN